MKSPWLLYARRPAPVPWRWFVLADRFPAGKYPHLQERRGAGQVAARDTDVTGMKQENCREAVPPGRMWPSAKFRAGEHSIHSQAAGGRIAHFFLASPRASLS